MNLCPRKTHISIDGEGKGFLRYRKRLSNDKELPSTIISGREISNESLSSIFIAHAIQ